MAKIGVSNFLGWIGKKGDKYFFDVICIILFVLSNNRNRKEIEKKEKNIEEKFKKSKKSENESKNLRVSNG